MSRKEQTFWIVVALLALPVAWGLGRLGHRWPVQEPLADLLWLAALAVAEEIVFRGGIQGWLLTRPVLVRARGGISAANAVTSLLFVAAHLWAHSPLQAAAVLPVSLLLGAAYERSGRRLVLPAALHVVFNGALYAASWLLPRG